MTTCDSLAQVVKRPINKVKYIALPRLTGQDAALPRLEYIAE